MKKIFLKNRRWVEKSNCWFFLSWPDATMHYLRISILEKNSSSRKWSANIVLTQEKENMWWIADLKSRDLSGGGWEKLNNVHSKFLLIKKLHLKNRKNENNAATFNENLNIKRNDFRSIYFDSVYTYWMDFSLCW